MKLAKIIISYILSGHILIVPLAISLHLGGHIIATCSIGDLSKNMLSEHKSSGCNANFIHFEQELFFINNHIQLFEFNQIQTVTDILISFYQGFTHLQYQRGPPSTL